MNIKLHKRLAIILFLSSIIILTISGLLGFEKYQRALTENAAIVENYQTIRAANQSLISLNEAALAVSTFLYSKDADAIKKLPEIIIAAQVNMSNLEKLTQDDPTEIQLMTKLNDLFNEKVKFLKAVINEYSSGNQEQAIKIASDKNRMNLTSDIMQLIIEIKKIEIGQAEAAIAYYKIDKIEAEKFFILAGSLNILLGLFNFVFIRRFLD